MVTAIIIALFATVVLIIGLFMMRGKLSFLIAGYNTASDEEKARYDEKKLCRSSGVVCIVVAVMLYIMAYLGYRIDAGLMAESAMLPFGVIFIAVVMAVVGCNLYYVNNKCRK